jgi:hypothetical protein
MEHLLFSDTLRPATPDQHIDISVYGTEQGLQLRVAYVSDREPFKPVVEEGFTGVALTDEEVAVLPKWLTRDAFSISYTEVLGLSYDIEKGNPPSEPYGVIGDYSEYLGPPKPL